MALHDYPSGIQLVELDFIEKTVAVTTTATTEGTATTVFTGNSFWVPAGTRIRLEVFTPSLQINAAGVGTYLPYYEDGVLKGWMGYHRAIGGGSGSSGEPVTALVYRTLTEGSHAYTLKMYVDGGTGTFSAGTGGAGAYASAYWRITRV